MNRDMDDQRVNTLHQDDREKGSRSFRIGFISTRLAGTDGVSLEVAKWDQVLTGLRHECFYFAGKCDWPAERSLISPLAHFAHPEILSITNDLFDDFHRSPETTAIVEKVKEQLKADLYRFIRNFDIHILIAENILSLPMNVPLALALTEVIAETCLPVIAHHHDFSWERTRYAVGAADDYLGGAFPPVLKQIYHVVINSSAERELALRRGVSSTLIPNVMDFETPPPERDAYSRGLRPALGMGSDEILLLQPTRVAPRKRIETAIELANRLDMPCRLLISHKTGDEGFEYEEYLRTYASRLNVPVCFSADVFQPHRGQTENGAWLYSLADAYLESDLVTYPSEVEGFGNAFLEAVYYRKPILNRRYNVFREDIQPKGFKSIVFDQFLTDQAVLAAKEVLKDKARVDEMTAYNYELGRNYFSYDLLEKKLVTLLDQVAAGGCL